MVNPNSFEKTLIYTSRFVNDQSVLSFLLSFLLFKIKQTHKNINYTLVKTFIKSALGMPIIKMMIMPTPSPKAKTAKNVYSDYLWILSKKSDFNLKMITAEKESIEQKRNFNETMRKQHLMNIFTFGLFITTLITLIINLFN